MPCAKIRILLSLALLAASCADPDLGGTGTVGEELSTVNGPIPASEILSRADTWYQHRWDSNMTYDQGGSHVDPAGKSYRRDCSGFVSMAWHLDHSRVTFQPDSLANVAERIAKDALQPGDLVMASNGGSAGGHAVLFEKWVDGSHGAYWAYEFGATPVQHHIIHTSGDDLYVGDGRVFLAYSYGRNTDGTRQPPGSDPPPPKGLGCSVDEDGRLNCQNTGGAAMHESPTVASPVVNHLRSTFSWFDCWGTGDRHAGGNTTWYHTLGDDNSSYGWVPGVDLDTPDAFDANPSAQGLRKCGGASSPPPPDTGACGVHSDGKLYCTNSNAAPIYASSVFSSGIVNHLRTTTSWFTCWGTGDRHAGGNTTWYYTLGDDNGSWGWVPGVNLNTPDAFDADPSAHGLARCGSSPARQPQPMPDNCSVHADGRLYCHNTGGAAMHSALTASSSVVNHLRSTDSWFECWGTGDRHAGGNTTWYYTLGDDNGNWGWVPAVDLSTTSDFDANPGASGLPLCDL